MKPSAEQSQIEKISASLTLVGFGLRPEYLTDILGIQPSYTDVSYVTRCGTSRKEECGLWSYDTTTCVSSRDVRKHIEYLLELFRPLRSRLEEIMPRPKVFVHVKCQAASIMQPLQAPRIDAALVTGLADLGAALTVELVKPAR